MNDVKYMLGYAPHPAPYWIFCWVFAAPVLILVRSVISKNLFRMDVNILKVANRISSTDIICHR